MRWSSNTCFSIFYGLFLLTPLRWHSCHNFCNSFSKEIHVLLLAEDSNARRSIEKPKVQQILPSAFHAYGESNSSEDSEELLLLVSGLVDVDSDLLGHWFRTICHVRPKSCQITKDKCKALVKLPQVAGKTDSKVMLPQVQLASTSYWQKWIKLPSISADFNSLVQRAYEPFYQIHGSYLGITRLDPTSQLLVDCHRSGLQSNSIRRFFQTKSSEHQLNVIPMSHEANKYICIFSSPQGGWCYGTQTVF